MTGRNAGTQQAVARVPGQGFQCVKRILQVIEKTQKEHKAVGFVERELLVQIQSRISTWNAELLQGANAVHLVVVGGRDIDRLHLEPSDSRKKAMAPSAQPISSTSPSRQDREGSVSRPKQFFPLCDVAETSHTDTSRNVRVKTMFHPGLNFA